MFNWLKKKEVLPSPYLPRPAVQQVLDDIKNNTSAWSWQFSRFSSDCGELTNGKVRVYVSLESDDIFKKRAYHYARFMCPCPNNTGYEPLTQGEAKAFWTWAMHFIKQNRDTTTLLFEEQVKKMLTACSTA